MNTYRRLTLHLGPLYFVWLQEHNNKRPLVLVRAPREHDLVLEMDSAASRRKFLLKLDTFLAQHKKAMNLTQVLYIKDSKEYINKYLQPLRMRSLET